MKGLLCKDFLGMKKHGILAFCILCVYTIAYVIFFIVSQSREGYGFGYFNTALSINLVHVMIFGVMTGSLCLAVPFVCLMDDRRHHWDRYIRSTPVSMDQFILSKYMLAGILCTASLAANSFLLLLTKGIFYLVFSDYSRGTIESLEGISVCFLFFLFGLLFVCIALPLLLGFGLTKGGIILLFAVLSAGVFLTWRWGELMLDYTKPALWLFSIITAVVLPCSFFISRTIYRRKNFS